MSLTSLYFISWERDKELKWQEKSGGGCHLDSPNFEARLHCVRIIPTVSQSQRWGLPCCRAVTGARGTGMEIGIASQSEKVLEPWF